MIALLLFSCADRSPEKAQTEQQQKEDSLTATLGKEATPEQEDTAGRDFPMLTSDNAEPFLRDYFKKNPERKIKLTTRLGEIKFRLYEGTPVHCANFLMLVKRDYFNGTEFTRIVENFVVQGGNNDKESEEIKRLLIGSYKLDPEFRKKTFHKRGALAMARSYKNNPEMKSSAYNFYFVQGQTYNEPQLLSIERDEGISIPPNERQVYKTTGGTPHLDNKHTIFGEIYEGFDVLEAISKVETDNSDWPKKPLVMQVEVIEEE